MTSGADPEGPGRSLPHGMLSDLLRRGGSEVSVRVAGASMHPTLPAGSEVRVTPIPLEEIEDGDPVAFLAGGLDLTLHRLVSRDTHPGFVLTRGDGNLYCDPPVLNEDVLGAVTAWRAGENDWRPVPKLHRNTRLPTRLNEGLMRAALSLHVRLAQLVSAASLFSLLPFAVFQYRTAVKLPPPIAMFRLTRPPRR